MTFNYMYFLIIDLYKTDDMEMLQYSGKSTDFEEIILKGKDKI